MSKLTERFGGAVRQRRKAHGMTQAALGDAVGLSEEWVRRIERGTGAPSFDTLEALAVAFHCTVADLFAPMSERDVASARIETLLSSVPDDDLPWMEELIRVAARRSTRHNP
ncbi:helix-turn-helix domain-containing protein [Erythrobacter sp. WG]|uniref:helix-turn-helix domain-containing protein n=1 Tax=Erythrobacter sp. WG TaxID=2985510 RepID=UPI002271F314|nr:helix-turn-helix transcriptional regulator [Erythrobacter sp. WG]MCX9147476.1 helix-turn-helix domain-containing protein [Erythrobacter sp. WG]